MVTSINSRRAVIVEDSGGRQVATVLDDLSTLSSDAGARSAIATLIERGRSIGLIHRHDHRQVTSDGLVYRMYGQPGDERFLDALADGLFEFGFIAYTLELTTK